MKMETNKMWQIFMLTILLTLAGCKNGGEYSQSVPEYATMQVAPVNKTLSTQYPAAIQGKQDIAIFPAGDGNHHPIVCKRGTGGETWTSAFHHRPGSLSGSFGHSRANMEAADATLATAQLTYDSKKELFAQNVISAYELKTAENNLLMAKAGRAQAKAQELSAANDLSYTEVKSPSDGVIGTLPYRVGTLVSAGMAQPLTTVSDNSDMYVYFSMTENQLLGLIRQYGSKDKALQSMPAIELVLNDRTTYEEKGTIATISGVVDASTGTVSVRAAFPNKNGLLHSGSSGNVVVPSVYKDGIIIPRAATYEVQDKVFVYKVVDGKTHSTQVSVERVDGGQDYIVTTGLAIGDEIVTEGVGLLQDGMPITKKK